MKKILALILTLIICVPMFGCGSQFVLRIACDKDIIGTEYFNKAIEYYQLRSNTKVEVVEYSKQMLTDSSVDIVIHPIDSDVISLGIENVFYDFSQEYWVNEVATYCYDSIMDNNYVYGLPFGKASITGCYYNKKMFEDLGLTLPNNQYEFDRLCSTIANVGITPIGVAGKEKINFELGFENVLSNRPTYVEDLNKGKLSMTEIPGMSLMAEWWKTYSDNGWFGENWMGKTSKDVAKELGAGYAAMVICDDAWINDNLGVNNHYKSMDFGVMPIYMGSSKAVYLGSQLPVISVKKNNAMAGVALDFVSLLSDFEVYDVCFSGAYTVPIFRDQSTIIVPEQFAEVSQENIISMSAVYPRIQNFDAQRASDSIKSYIEGKISVDDCVKAIGNGR